MPNMRMTLIPDEGEYGEEDFEPGLHVDAHYIVCDRCHGTGTHWHSAFSNGITQEERQDWDDEEWDGLMTGRYDVVCEECEGKRVILEPLVERLRPAELVRWHQYQRDLYECDAIQRQELRMGA